MTRVAALQALPIIDAGIPGPSLARLATARAGTSGAFSPVRGARGWDTEGNGSNGTALLNRWHSYAGFGTGPINSMLVTSNAERKWIVPLGSSIVIWGTSLAAARTKSG